MANFLIKKQSDSSYNIYIARKLVGTLTRVGCVWNGMICHDGIREQVVSFSCADNAFYALTMALKVARLHKRGGAFVALARQGSTDAEERADRDRALREYVPAFNVHNSGGAQLRIVNRRR